MFIKHMHERLINLKSKLNHDGDTEPEQALFRVFIGIILAAYFCLPWHEGESFTSVLVSTTGIIFLTGLCTAIGLFIATQLDPDVSPKRRVLGIILDISMLSGIMYLTDGEHVPLFVFYLWVVIGNGFRYGIPYLYISQLLSLIGFSCVILWGRYWQHYPSIALSLLLILGVLPLYAGFLLKKLHHAVDAARQANQAKSRFLANMSHELRTPLNGVIGMGELLRETNLTFEQHELVKGMHNSATTLLELIENVLDISKIEAGKLLIDSKPFDLHALVNSVHYMLAPMAKAKGISFSCHINPETPFNLNGDQPHIRQVLINLISNAIKFTDEGMVKLYIHQVEGAAHKPRIRFEIKDTGIGIAEDAQQKIFENFTQADASSSRKYGGTGLGTTISKDLVELMGGKMGLFSKLGVGSTFWFELPFEVIPQATESLSTGRLLLLVSEETALTVKPALKDWSLNFDWVQSPARALSLLVRSIEKRQGYDIVIVDRACMSDVNPVQFAQLVRAEKDLEHLSMILVGADESVIADDTINQFFIATLDAPQDKRLLFNAIHAAQSVHVADENVVTLAEHYAKLGSAKALNILVAEDNFVNRQVIEGILKRAGHRVILTDSGEKALDILSQDLDQIDLVVLDMNMPVVSGIEVVKTLRFMDPNKSIPVIMLTADATPEARKKSINAGANSFLTKPIDARLMLEKVAILTKHLKDKGSAKVVQSKAIAQQNQGSVKKSPWLDDSILRELMNLGEDVNFMQQLVEGFYRDGSNHVQNILTHEDKDYPAYRESLHALKGSATELGATELVKICLKGEGFKPYDIGTDKLKRLNREVENTFHLTVTALQEAVNTGHLTNPNNLD